MTTAPRSGVACALLLAMSALLLPATEAAAQGQERLCDPAHEDCRAVLRTYIMNEHVGIDVAFWFMEDDLYRAWLVSRHRAGVPVRVLIDPDANPTYPRNAMILSGLAAAGIPMRRHRTGGYILHWKMMLFRGQGVVEFSGANYSANALAFEVPYVNYIDEAIFFTDDPPIVNSFREKFDDHWVDMINWEDYANITSAPQRLEPDGTYVEDPQLNFPPEQNYRTRALGHYKQTQTASNGRGVDVIMYRITDRSHTDAMISLEARGVPVRLYTEQAQYRLTSRMWHSWNVDRLYMAGVEVRDRAHAGLNHQKSVILYDQSPLEGDQPLVIFGSSNWTSPSAAGQVEHNLFTSKPELVTWFVEQFDRKWNNLAAAPETKPFQPLPPDKPKTPTPAHLAPDVSTTTTLAWNGGAWAHLYDLYLDTNPNPTTLVASHVADVNLREKPNKTETSAFTYVLPAGTLLAGTTYYWKVVGKTMALREAASPVWRFTTAGAVSPPPPTPSSAGDIVLYASRALVPSGWSVVSDATAAGGARLANVDAGAAKLATALANPTQFFELTFSAQAGVPYRLWIRGRAQNDYWGNDSVFVQFSNSVTTVGTATWRIGTTSATDVNLEACSGCGLSGWGWQDNGWGTGVMGPVVQFDITGLQTIRIQTREDGLSIDQVVLSPSTYLNASPGALKNDTTILAEKTGGTAP
jgi:phosphatidylserine/phosphatidylglycerophosphate/cardiolipin synthase-like enzyme